MDLWMAWLAVVRQLRPACARTSTFWWMVVILVSFSTRSDLAGVSSFVRCHWLREKCYNRILDRFSGSGIKLDILTQLWASICLKIFAKFLVKEGGRIILLADGIKNPKEGRKMPGVKFCHQESNNNSKPEYIMAHSIQAISLLVGSAASFFGVPLVARIHEGIVLSNRDKRTLYDKLNMMISNLNLSIQYYLVADAYYAVQKIIKGALANGNHLISRCRTNVVAYLPAPQPGKRQRGRPRKYGEKVKLKELFASLANFTEIDSPFPGETGVKIQYLTLDLLWRPIGQLIRFVLVVHPKGRWILIGTDLNLDPVRMIVTYGLRFRIELCFKQLIYVVGAFAYRFWSRNMKKASRGDGDQYLHRAPESLRQKILDKIRAYHLHLQLGLIALGLLQWLSLSFSQAVWTHFGSWMRTMKTQLPPSELVVASAMRNTLADFLVSLPEGHDLAKFLDDKLDLDRAPVYLSTG
jgi:hypothetical protein